MAIPILCRLQYAGQLLKFWDFSVSSMQYKYRFYSSTEKTFVPLFLKMQPWLDNIAITDEFGSHTYRDVLQSSCNLSCEIKKMIKIRNHDSKQWRMTKVAIPCERNVSFVVSLYACWLAGAVPVPVNFHSLGKPQYPMRKTGCVMMIATDYQDSCYKLSKRLNKPVKALRTADYVKAADSSLGFWDIMGSTNHLPSKTMYTTLVNEGYFRNIPAIVFFDIDSTNKRMHTDFQLSFMNIHTRLQSLASAMNCTRGDVVLHTLPLNNVYCIIDVLLLQLFSGARTVMPNMEDIRNIWKELLPENKETQLQGYTQKLSNCQVNKVMAYQNLYTNMMKNQNLLPNMDKSKLTEVLKDISMYTIGDSGYLYIVARNWYQLTANSLCVLYTKSECGPIMVTKANVYQKVQTFVYRGKILPGVKGRIVLYKDGGRDCDVIVEFDGPETVKVSENVFGVEGELQLRGPGIIQNYREIFQNQFTPKGLPYKLFTSDGWLRTRDLAMLDKSENVCISSPYSLQWIDKSDNFVYARVIQGRLLQHPLIEMAEIFRIPNHQHDNSVAVALVLKKFDDDLTTENVQQFLRNSGLDQHLIPAMVKVYLELPRHANQSLNRRLIQSMLFFS